MLRSVDALLKTTTAEFKVPPSTPTNGNGHADAAERGQVRNGGGNGHRRRVRRQIHKGYRRAALKADTAVILVEDGMTVTEAVKRCETGFSQFYALQALRESGNVTLHKHVLKGDEPVLASGRRVANAAAAITALQKCSGMERELVRLATGMTSDPVTMLLNLEPDQLVAVTNALGTEWVWEQMIIPAMPTKSTTESTTKPTTTMQKTVLTESASTI
jgi:hypothetical protein